MDRYVDDLELPFYTRDLLSVCQNLTIVDPNPLQIWVLLLHGDMTSPLIRLACRIFAVCPNSASCERLFSLLKCTMTPAHTRLTSQNLMNVAELHAHLRKGHKRTEDHTRRVKRKLNPVQGPGLPPAGMSTHRPTIDLSSPVISSSNPHRTFTEPVEDLSVEDGDAEDGAFQTTRMEDGAVGATSDLSPSTLTVVAQELMRLSDNDNDLAAAKSLNVDRDRARARAADSSTFTSSPFLLDITEVFNFSEMYWVAAIDGLAESAIMEEMELYDELSKGSGEPAVPTPVATGNV